MRSIPVRGSLALLSVVVCVACDTSQSPSPSEPAKSAIQTLPAPSATAPPARPRPRMGLMGRFTGPAGLLFAATRELQLSEDQQKKLEQINQDFRTPPPDPMAELNTELVSGVKEGKIDKAKLESRYTAIETAESERSDKEAKALEGLHATLTPEQRKTLATKVRSRQRPPPAVAKAPGADAEEKKLAKERAEQQAAQIAQQLGFDEAQQKKLVPVFAKAAERPDPQQHAPQREALLSAFEQDTFEAKKLLDAFASPKEVRARAKRRADQVSAMLTVAKPDQRPALASWVEQSGSPFGLGHFRGPGGPGPGMRPGGPGGRPGGFGRPMPPMPMPSPRPPPRSTP